MKIFKTVLLISIFIPLQSFAIPAFPMSFWGSITIDGNSATVGTLVRAYYSTSTLAGEVSVKESGIYGYNDSLKQKLIVSEGQGTITFKIVTNGSETAGLEVQSEQTFSSGITKQKNLAFKITNTTVPPGGGGGTGGGISPAAVPVPTINKSDANNDGKVNKYDFALLMANWGKTGSNICDFNGDGKVDKYDFSLLMSKWSI